MWAVSRKEWRDLWREKTILVAVVVQLFVAGFSTFVLVGLQGLTEPDSVSDFPDVRAAYVGDGGFDRYMSRSPGLIASGTTLDLAMERFNQGDIDIVVEEIYDDPAAQRSITILFVDGDPLATLQVTRMKGLLEDYEKDLREDRGERLETPLVEARSAAGEITDAPPLRFAYATLLPLLVLVPVFLSGSITGDTFSQEVQGRTLTLLRAAPATTGAILGGKLLVAVSLAPMQVLLWLGLYALNGFRVQGVGWLLLFTVLLAIVLASVGLLIAALVRREGQTQAAYALAALTLGAGAMLLPRDPLNLIALLSTGTLDALGMATLAITAITAATLAIIAISTTHRAIRTDRLGSHP